jgi:hypothetical protein
MEQYLPSHASIPLAVANLDGLLAAGRRALLLTFVSAA